MKSILWRKNVILRKEKNGATIYNISNYKTFKTNKTGYLIAREFISGKERRKIIKTLQKTTSLNEIDISRFLDLLYKLQNEEISSNLSIRTCGQRTPVIPEKPITVAILLTSRCNLMCKHCYSNSKPTHNKVLKWKKISPKIKELDPIQIQLGGGEPLLHPEILSILKELSDDNRMIILNTNGTLLQKHLKDLRKFKHLFMAVSLDGTKEIHDKIRGKGTFNKTVENIKAALKEGMNVYVRMTLSKTNAHCIEEFVKEMESIGIEKIEFDPLKLFGRATKDMLLTPEEYFICLKKLCKIENSKKYKIKLSFITEFYSSLPTSTSHLPRKKISGACMAKYCEGGTLYMAIDFNGDVYPCAFLTGSNICKVGNAYKDNLLQLWKNNNKWGQFRTGFKISGYCKICKYVDYCSTGCPSLKFGVNKKWDGPDIYCWHKNKISG
jgi:radical SAM protein with 4Fe4S-binding SPASM domain